MRSVRFLHPAEDGSHLVLETADGDVTDGVEQFTLAVDEPLRAALAPMAGDTAVNRKMTPGAEPDAEPDGEPPTPSTARHAAAESAGGSSSQSITGEAPIGPREIQVRVRAGESPGELAAQFGMPIERIMRFASPVVAERLRIADEARRSRARRSTTEGAVVMFGEAVDERFAAHGIAPSDVSWDSYRRDDGEWVVAADWLGGEGRHQAEWVFSRVARTVHPIDETAVDLLSDRPIRPVAPPAPAQPDPPQLRVAPPLVPGLVSFPPMPDARTGPVPHLDEVFDQEAQLDAPRLIPPLRSAHGDRTPAVSAAPTAPADERFGAFPRAVSLPAIDAEAADGQAGESAAPAPSAVPVAPGPTERADHFADAASPIVAADVAADFDVDFDVDFEAQSLPLGIAMPMERPGVRGVGALHNLSSRRAESDDDRAARARIPSWDDIVLGVRRNTEA